MAMSEWKIDEPELGSNRTRPFLTEAELAGRWGLSRRTLQRWRRANHGPRWLRLRRRILYRKEDVLAYEAVRLIGGEE